jgi:transposase
MAGDFRRVEVITGTARRRTWSSREKARLVAESLEPGASVSRIARRHGVSPGQLFTWRREAMRSASGGDAASTPAFVPVSISEPTSPSPRQSSSIEIEVHGARIHVRDVVDETALRAVLSAVRGVR